jgi:hypothetical protein
MLMPPPKIGKHLTGLRTLWDYPHSPTIYGNLLSHRRTRLHEMGWGTKVWQTRFPRFHLLLTLNSPFYTTFGSYPCLTRRKNLPS